ncbi:YchJ family protein [Brachybacterium hainanense]|uniref:YchJ family protein n=1 Tax=Brachybacterium hainanense TaxID=1541174 RepID=A0ABV6RCA9_9MICO
MSDDMRCPCGSGDPLADCCAPILDRRRQAGTAQQLMRSRYTAFALRDLAHLLVSWHPSTRPVADELARSLEDGTRWLHLAILRIEAGGPFDDQGTVEFRALAKGPGGRVELHETSRFVREDGHWLYVDGDVV